MNEHFARQRRRLSALYEPDLADVAHPLLLAVPDPYFLDGLELALAGSYHGTVRAVVQEVNRLFEARGIWFAVDGVRTEWTGDRGTYSEVIRPALDALDDPRLHGCRDEFEAALRHVRAGTQKDREDAIEEAAKAVESAMKVLLDDVGVRRSGRETAQPLFELLRDNNIVPARAQDAVLAASRLRNEYGGHGQGSAPRTIPNAIPELTVHAAGAAITYLASRLNI